CPRLRASCCAQILPFPWWSSSLKSLKKLFIFNSGDKRLFFHLMRRPLRLLPIKRNRSSPQKKSAFAARNPDLMPGFD
ncbi:MAG: hypothetical protein RR296_06960, partial [Clostridia bacterium]